MATTTPQRAAWDWNDHPVQLGYACRLHRRRGDRVLETVCALQSHVFGWKLSLPQPAAVAVTGLLVVGRGARRVRAVMVETGWR